MPETKHMDRLSAIDTTFLAQERGGSHMHIGGIFLFDGDPPGREELVEHIESRLHLVPRYRQKLIFPRAEIGRPLWIDDPHFNAEFHIRHTALPDPGSLEELRLLAGRIFSQRLDRSKPLWEIWLVQGLREGGFALLSKSHHALVDGVSGVDIFTVLFDLDEKPARIPAPERDWSAPPEPSQAQLVAAGLRDATLQPLRIAARALGAARSPRRTIADARETVESLGTIAWTYLSGAPKTPLNVPIGPHRRVRWVDADLDDLKAAKNAFGGTVNDVFLSIVSGALRGWLRSRGVRTEGLELRGLVPISTRADAQHGDLGNQIVAAVGPLPVYCDDPVERLEIVRREMADLKESKQALGAERITTVQEFTPATLLAQASRLNFSPRLYNLLVTNVPGPQFPLYLLGRELRHAVPIAFLAPDMALAVAIMSYNGSVSIALIADYDAIPDLDQLAGYVEAEIEALGEAVAAANGQRKPRRRAKPRGARAAARTGA